MATTIKLKNSVTTTNAPSSLAQGEVAINITDKKVWVGNAATTPIQLLGDGGSASFTSIAFGAGTVSSPSITFTGDTNTGIYSPAADTIAFTEGGVERMRIDSSGNVGIGTSSPASNLHIAGTTTAVVSRISATTGAPYSLYTNSGSSFFVGKENSASGSFGATAYASVLYEAGAYPMTFWTNAAERMRITSAGDLLLGTTSSTGGKFHMQGNYARLTDGTYTGLFGKGSDLIVGGGASDLGIRSDAAILFSYGSTERMRIDSSGRVGIGETNLSNTLTVSASQATARFNSTSSSQSVYQQFVTNGISLYLGRDNSAGTDFGTAYATYLYSEGAYPVITWINGSERMRIATNGNVGLGTTLTANGRLTVAGYTTSTANADILINRSGTASTSIGTGANLQLANISSDKSVLLQGSDDVLQFFNFNGSSWTERMRLTSVGELLVGTTNAGGTVGAGFKIINSAQGVVVVTPESTNGGRTTYELYSTGAGAYRFYVGAGGTIFATSTTISAISDIRLKENIQDIDVGLDKVMALKPRKFDWKTGKGKDKKGDRGWIAQEFEQVFPEMIDTWKDPAPEGEEPYKSVNADLIPVLVKAIQEQQAMIEELKQEVAKLKGV